MKLLSCVWLAFLSLSVGGGVKGAATHERESDGAFSPRGVKHAKEGDHAEGHFDHEAILGSHKEAEEYEQLPPSEAKDRLSKLALKMDRDHDRMIDKEELYAWILRSFKMLSEEDAKERLKEIDDNQDGFVSWEEYKREEFDGLDEEVKNGEKLDEDQLEELSMLEEDKMLFEAADVDGNGVLNGVEFVSFSHPEDDPETMRESVIALAKKGKDKNGDGQLDFQEFVGERAKERSKDWLVSEKERFDEDLDKDSDGYLNDAEIFAWIVPSNEDIAKEEVEHLFVGSDDDHDDKLSLDEIVKHHDIFVGSEATDYGEHLHNINRFGDEL